MNRSTLTLADLPPVARLAIGFSFFSAWVIFEEGVLDRFGLWQHLPLYVKAQFCPWDLGAFGLIFVPLMVLTRRSACHSSTASPPSCIATASANAKITGQA